MVREFDQEEIDEQIILFLEADMESCEYDFPEWSYSNAEDFNIRSAEKWAMQEIMRRIESGLHAEDAVWQFCGDMINYTSRAKSNESRDFFNNAYYYGYYLNENWDAIIYDE